MGLEMREPNVSPNERVHKKQKPRPQAIHPHVVVWLLSVYYVLSHMC